MSENNKILTEQCLDSSSAQVLEGKGKNIIPPPVKEPLWRQYLRTFADPLIIILLVAFLFSLIMALYEVHLGASAIQLLEPLGVVVALLLATGVGFIFEVKAGREFDILNKVKDSRKVKVLRKSNGSISLTTIAKCDVVKGDVVRLEAGDEIPADGTLIFSQSLQVDESNFTGEPFASKTENTEDADSDTEAAYPCNFLLRGSTVIGGNGYYRVDAIGVDTEEARGIEKEHEGSGVKTPLDKQLDFLGKWISVASAVIGVLIVIGREVFYFTQPGTLDQFMSGEYWPAMHFGLNSLLISITLVVCAVPEGLPMAVTVSLALSMRKMLKENNLVRKLHACETMGAATVICTDKTGTLTQNKMTVMETCFFGDTDKQIIFDGIAVNSTAELGKDENGTEQNIGNPTEIALLNWMKTEGVDYHTYRNEMNLIEQQPFSTETKFMESTVRLGNGTVRRYYKGAPEIILEMSNIIAGGKEKHEIENILLGYQQKAMRTLGFAYKEGDGDITFIGVVGVADPIRDDVAEAIHICRDYAGVRVIIVTGDTPGTASEIGRQIGLIDGNEPDAVLTGSEFRVLSDEQAKTRLKSLKVIARAKPDDKARLVTLLQEMDEVVAVTGDGTNDAPALSKAQVGLSMGDGTARAKEASDITIIDNSFSSINKAIMWGRSLYMNIRRFIVYQTTINLCACFIVLMGAFTGLDSPLTVTQMLWVNLIMDTFAAMALSSLPAEESVLHRAPRSPKAHIIDRAMLWRLIGTGTIFFVLLSGLWQLLWHCDVTSVSQLFTPEHLKLYVTGFFGGMTEVPGKTHMNQYESAIFFTFFIMLQFWNLINVRYFCTSHSLILDIKDIVKGRWSEVKKTVSKEFYLILVAILAGQIIIVQFGGEMFQVSALSLSDWLWIIGTTALVVVVGDIRTTIRNIIKKTRLHKQVK